MKKNIIILLGAIAILFSCARPPEDEMNRAIEALSRAENDADAVMYAPNYISRSREALAKMQEEANSKRYESAKTYAEEAISNAERAISEGSIAAARAGDNAAALLNSLAVPLAETEANLNAAKEVPNIELDFAPLEGMLDSAKRSYDSALDSLSENNFRDALSRGQNVQPILSNINSQISGATVATFKKQ